MSDGKKVNDQAKPKLLGKVEILVLSDGNVSVKGPIDNLVIMMNIFGRAMNAVANHAAEKIKGSQIVGPQRPPIVTLN